MYEWKQWLITAAGTIQRPGGIVLPVESKKHVDKNQVSYL